MKHLISLVAAGVLAACGSGNKPAATTPATPPVAAVPAGTWQLGELKFYQGAELGMQLHSNGHLEVKVVHSETGKPAQETWQDVGAIGADGSLTGPDGTKHGEIKPDGSLLTRDGQTGPFHLEGETLVVADKKLTIDDKGLLQGGNDVGTPMRIEGATSPGLRRTALVVLAIVMSSRAPAETAPPEKRAN